MTSKDFFRSFFWILKWVKGPGSTKSRSLSNQRKGKWADARSSDAFQALLAISSLLTSRFRETFWDIHRMIFFHRGRLAFRLSDWAHPFSRNPWREIISFFYSSRFLAWKFKSLTYPIPDNNLPRESKQKSLKWRNGITDKVRLPIPDSRFVFLQCTSIPNPKILILAF